MRPGKPRGAIPDFAIVQSGLLSRSDDQLIGFDPELRTGAVEVAFGEEGVEQRFRRRPPTQIFDEQRAGAARIGGGLYARGEEMLRLRWVFCRANRFGISADATRRRAVSFSGRCHRSVCDHCCTRHFFNFRSAA